MIAHRGYEGHNIKQFFWVELFNYISAFFSWVLNTYYLFKSKTFVFIIMCVGLCVHIY